MHISTVFHTKLHTGNGRLVPDLLSSWSSLEERQCNYSPLPQFPTAFTQHRLTVSVWQIFAGVLNWRAVLMNRPVTDFGSFLESLLRSVFEKPNQPLSRARRRMCYSVSDLQPAALRRNCTEHDPGYLHAATRWTHAAAALLSARLTGMWRPVGTECLCMISMKKKDVHFDSVSATSVTVKYLLNTYSFALSIYLYLYIFKRKSTKLYFLGEMFTSVEFVNLSTLQIGAVVFSLKHKRGAVIAKNVKLPPRLSYSLL